jgi:hypothetical protein
MNEFTEVRTHSLQKIHIQADPQDHSERLLSKEWLIKIDNERSIPYLMVRPSYSILDILRRLLVEATPNFRRSNMRLPDNRY